MAWHYYTVSHRQSRMEAFIADFIHSPLPNPHLGEKEGIVLKDSKVREILSQPKWYKQFAQYKEFFERDGYKIHTYYATSDSNQIYHYRYVINNQNYRVMEFEFMEQNDELEVKLVSIDDCTWEYRPPKEEREH